MTLPHVQQKPKKMKMFVRELKSVNVEIRCYLHALFKKNTIPENKFVIFSQGRTGSNLVGSLLHCHPQIIGGGEIFLRYYFRIPFPELFVEGRAARFAPNMVYGFQLQPFHFDFHKIDGKQFLSHLHEKGWKIIYLTRTNWFHQKISSMIAVYKNKWHYRANESNLEENSKIYIDSNELLTGIGQKETDYIKDKELLGQLPYLEINYENDLSMTERHQQTADKIFAYLNLPSAPTQTTLQKTPYELSDIVENYDEIVTLLSQTPYAHFLEK